MARAPFVSFAPRASSLVRRAVVGHDREDEAVRAGRRRKRRRRRGIADLELESSDVAPWTVGAGDAALIGRRAARPVGGVEGGASRRERAGPGGAAVVGEEFEAWIDVD